MCSLQRAAVAAVGIAAAVSASSASPSPSDDPFNCTSQPAGAFLPIVLTNGVPGMSATLIPYGATLTHLVLPDAAGAPVDVVLGFDDATDYCAFSQAGAAVHPYFGATIGRVANRIANCSFALGGNSYKLPCNEESPVDGGDTLHGGTVGFDRVAWDVAAVARDSVTFATTSPDGDMGFPGALGINVTFTLTGAAPHPALHIAYSATALTPGVTTVVSMTNHAYFNLHGCAAAAGGTVLEHVLSMPTAAAFLGVDGALIPTGDVVPVADAPWMDFTAAGGKPIGRDIANGTVTPGGGYDNAWVFGAPAAPPGAGARAGGFVPLLNMSSPLSGIALRMWSDQPSVQGYSGNMLTGSIPRKASQCPGGVPSPACTYPRYGAFTLEAQAYPDAVHHANFPPITLAPGGEYTQHTAYEFISVNIAA